ncbi:MAG: signal peptide peptidase [Bdellovibrionales bacterium RIFCSPHIGHO2_01_FULL_40_29]|nr:MAG: signal peptide peptidase [Bdellovibrionales bacterium RIFCSPHIGHO2_01_FULL_40_29]OFZ33388.1 MAG: signal peptide peptidase [Bdellovibrionales bacterium RIFCSPHIGHO2_02_FULL_40_15]
MSKWSFRKKFFVGLVLFFVGFGIYKYFTNKNEETERAFSKNEILHLEIHGVIMNGKKFLSNLKKYKKDNSVKAIVIDINSPGGAVGPSQEIYYEILRAKQETKKPIICVSTGLIASGGYYASLACDKIVVTPGALIGSIGVIMEFANLEELYGWAKIKRYTITSGKFKDSGAEYRSMRDDERQLFQDMINEVYEQFRSTVASARNLSASEVAAVADGRVMTGSAAVRFKLADAEGTFEDAVRMAAQAAHLGDDYRIFKPRRDKMGFWDVLDFADEDDDELNTLQQVKEMFTQKSIAGEAIHSLLKVKYLNQPLFLMPGYWE